MRHHIINILHPLFALLLLAACSSEGDTVLPEQPTAEQLPCTYRMTLRAAVAGYDDTRAATPYAFQGGDRVHVLFQQGSQTISGVAVYQDTTDDWQLTVPQSLQSTDDGSCSLAFLPDADTQQTADVPLTQQTRLYTAAVATYQLIDGSLNVQGTLTPALGRIRFHGTAGQKCTVMGLSHARAFSLGSHVFTLSQSQFTATCAADGYTDYFYTCFSDADSRTLTFVLTAESGYRRTFAASVLAPGTSGYVDIPTADSHDGWTLVNLAGGGEISFPTVTAPVATSVGSSRISLTAQITATGGGRVTEAGFVIATTHNPRRNTLNDVPATVDNSFSAQATGLTELTTYYVCAYAVNEAGITYSDETTVTTKAKADDSSDVDYDDYGSDENWGGTTDSEANVDHTTWPADENWN